MPLFDKVRDLAEVKDAFNCMKKLTLSESAWDLHRLKVLKLCWHGGLLVHVFRRRQKKEFLADICELYGKKLLAKALIGLAEYRKAR